MPNVLKFEPYCFVFFSSDKDKLTHIYAKRDRLIKEHTHVS